MLQFVIGFYLLPSWSGYIKKHLVQKLRVSCYLRRLVTNASEDFWSKYQSFNLMEAVPKKDLMIVLFNVWVNCLLKTGLQDKCFWRCRVSLVKFSYWSNFHVSIITGSRVMTIFLYIVFTRDPEIGNTPVWVLSNIWRMGWIRDIAFGTNIPNEMLLNVAKCQGYSFYHFWVIEGNATGVL